MTTTLETLKSSILTETSAEMERDPVPAFIAELCAKHVGKPVTKRHVSMIEAKFPGLRVFLSRSFGMTRFEWNVQDYNLDSLAAHNPPEAAARRALLAAGVKGHDGYNSMLLAHAETGAVWPTVEELRRRNTWCFEARDKRNAERAETLAAVQSPVTETILRNSAHLIDALASMVQELEGHLEHLPPAVRAKAREMVDGAIKSARDRMDESASEAA